MLLFDAVKSDWLNATENVPSRLNLRTKERRQNILQGFTGRGRCSFRDRSNILPLVGARARLSSRQECRLCSAKQKVCMARPFIGVNAPSVICKPCFSFLTARPRLLQTLVYMLMHKLTAAEKSYFSAPYIYTIRQQRRLESCTQLCLI